MDDNIKRKSSTEIKQHSGGTREAFMFDANVQKYQRGNHVVWTFVPVGEMGCIVPGLLQVFRKQFP